jgi:hypothetical protein
MLLRDGRDSDALDFRARHGFVRRLLPEVGRFLARPAPVDRFLECRSKRHERTAQCYTRLGPQRPSQDVNLRAARRN